MAKAKILPPFPESDWRPTPVAQLPSWAAAKRVSIDTEMKDPMLDLGLGTGCRHGGYVVGYSFAIEGGPSHYVPFRHEGGDNVPADAALSYLRDQATLFEGDLVGANLGYDLGYFAELGIFFPKVRWFRDVQNAEPLIDELQFSYSLDNVAKRRGFAGKDESLLTAAAAANGWIKQNDVKANLWRLPARYVGPYAIRDVVLPLDILRAQEKDIAEQDLRRVWDLESKVLPALVRMTRRGVRVDLSRLEGVERWANKREEESFALVRQITGISVGIEDVWKSAALAPVLEAIGVRVPLTPKTQKPSVKADMLWKIDHPVAKAILKARKASKVKGFAESMRRYEVGGRIHCTFNQLRATKDDRDDEDERGARYGRLSSSDPNLQQQPARDPEIGPMWRSIFVPDEGALWACDDFSQQEPRWAVHYAEALGLTGASVMAERYRTDPTVDNHDMMAQLIKGQPSTWKPDKATRDGAKIIFLGKIYGMGGGKMSRSLGLPVQIKVHSRDGRQYEAAGPEGQAIIDAFDAALPWVRQLQYRATDSAKRRGYVFTNGGRRCRFPIGPQGYEWTHKALNRVIQGTSADQMKQAMVDADAAGFPIQLQVHDELDMSVANASEAFALAEIMRNAMPGRVPFKVDVEIGPSWGELSKA